jgi:hypothetical protein
VADGSDCVEVSLAVLGSFIDATRTVEIESIKQYYKMTAPIYEKHKLYKQTSSSNTK